jgi:hypothetical protein
MSSRSSRPASLVRIIAVTLSLQLVFGVAVRAQVSERASLAAAVRPTLVGAQRVRHAAIVDGYALLVVGDQRTGGERTYKKSGSRWVFLGGGGGVAGAMDLVTLYHVPLQVARALVARVDRAPAL